MDTVDSIVYLLNVVTNWKQFCKGHNLFKEAIITVLCENQMLKCEIERLKEQNKNEK